jgi:hypothetical protein
MWYQLVAYCPTYLTAILMTEPAEDPSRQSCKLAASRQFPGSPPPVCSALSFRPFSYFEHCGTCLVSQISIRFTSRPHWYAGAAKQITARRTTAFKGTPYYAIGFFHLQYPQAVSSMQGDGDDM